jgi:hypothetical protein
VRSGQEDEVKIRPQSASADGRLTIELTRLTISSAIWSGVSEPVGRYQLKIHVVMPVMAWVATEIFGM